MSPDLPAALPASIVEAAARAEYAVDAAAEESDDFEPIEWDQTLPRIKDYYRKRAGAALAAALAECEVAEEWAVRVDRPHPKRNEKAGDYIRLADEQIARYGPRVWDGWVPVSRVHCISAWQPASPVDTPREETDQ